MSMYTHRSSILKLSSRALPFLLGMLFVGLIIRNAWLSDDAYITFRTVDNVVHGYGPTWNIAERVQTYTHPLWMGLLTAFYGATREIYFTSLLLSIAISIAAVWVLVRRPAPARSVLALVIFCCSKAFVDYATSGLENALTHLVLAGFLLLYLRGESTPRQLFWLALLASLGMLNRLDTALLFAPALAWALVRCRSLRAVGLVALGLVPLLLWELFSLFYYGMLFPNTAYAKLNAGLITQGELLREGLYYLQNSLRVDPVTLVAIGMAAVLPFAARDWKKLPIVAGILLYLAYTVKVGGDFMSGRFLTAPLLAAVTVLAHSDWPPTRYVWGLVGVVMALGLSAPYAPLRAGGAESADRDPRIWVRGRSITDERANYYPNTGLWLALTQGRVLPDHDWAQDGRADRSAGPKVTVKSSVGFYGYFAGPDVHIVDLLGLGDPLLARLPVTDPNWKIGHFGRRLPAGYLETLETGANRIQNPDLAAYYDSLALITRAPLWEPRRWLEIWRFNTGSYDARLASYAYFRGTEFIQDVDIINTTGLPFVYAYVWNHGSGETYLLDDASTRGQTYAVRWTLTAAEVAFSGAHKQLIAELGSLSDREPLAMGVYFSDSAALTAYDIYEYRFWFCIEDAGRVAVTLPPLAWRNSEAPQGYWRESDISPVMRLADR